MSTTRYCEHCSLPMDEPGENPCRACGVYWPEKWDPARIERRRAAIVIDPGERTGVAMFARGRLESIVALDATHSAELARRLEAFHGAVLAIPKDTGRSLLLDSLASFRTAFEVPVLHVAPPCLGAALRHGPTFRQRLTLIAILATYARAW